MAAVEGASTVHDLMTSPDLVNLYSLKRIQTVCSLQFLCAASPLGRALKDIIIQGVVHLHNLFKKRDRLCKRAARAKMRDEDGDRQLLYRFTSKVRTRRWLLKNRGDFTPVKKGNQLDLNEVMAAVCRLPERREKKYRQLIDEYMQQRKAFGY